MPRRLAHFICALEPRSSAPRPSAIPFHLPPFVPSVLILFFRCSMTALLPHGMHARCNTRFRTDAAVHQSRGRPCGHHCSSSSAPHSRRVAKLVVACPTGGRCAPSAPSAATTCRRAGPGECWHGQGWQGEAAARASRRRCTSAACGAARCSSRSPACLQVPVQPRPLQEGRQQLGHRAHVVAAQRRRLLRRWLLLPLSAPRRLSWPPTVHCTCRCCCGGGVATRGCFCDLLCGSCRWLLAGGGR